MVWQFGIVCLPCLVIRDHFQTIYILRPPLRLLCHYWTPICDVILPPTTPIGCIELNISKILMRMMWRWEFEWQTFSHLQPWATNLTFEAATQLHQPHREGGKCNIEHQTLNQVQVPFSTAFSFECSILSVVPSALRPCDPLKGDWIVRQPVDSELVLDFLVMVEEY